MTRHGGTRQPSPGSASTSTSAPPRIRLRRAGILLPKKLELLAENDAFRLPSLSSRSRPSVALDSERLSRCRRTQKPILRSRRSGEALMRDRRHPSDA